MRVKTKKIRYILRKSGSPFRQMRLWIKHKLGWLDTPVIVPYMGFSNGCDVYLHGSVMENKGIKKPHAKQSVFTNMLAMIKRYVSDEISGVRIEISCRDQKKIIETSALGIFHCQFSFPGCKVSESYFETVHYRLIDKLVEQQPIVEAEGKVLVVHQRLALGIISDIDDTIMVSHSIRPLRKIRLMLFKNAYGRVPFEGVSALYQALHKGRKDQDSFNPVFYVSSSEWNLYDLLEDFFNIRGIPAGPLLLQELQHSIIKFWKSGGGTHNHKLVKIGLLLSFFEDLSFILIGDSGQRDPELYLQAVEKFPGRIKAVYIRSVGKRKKKKHLEIARQMDSYNVPMLLINDSSEVAQHAKEQGFIDPESMPDIFKQTKKDKEKILR